MTHLLVSVRTLEEALLAADAGVDLIDVKEPARGALGFADAEVRRAIGQRLGQQHCLSAACGELFNFPNIPADSSDSADWIGYRFAKIGMVGCEAFPHWREEWLAWREALPPWVEPVLVCYIDGEQCGAPSYADLRAFAFESRIRMMLFDTWDKHGPGLCQLWQPADFLRVGQELRQAGISFVLAGKLELADVAGLLHCGASYLGIRGAVCDRVESGADARCGNLNLDKIKSWQRSLRTRIHDTKRTR